MRLTALLLSVISTVVMACGGGGEVGPDAAPAPDATVDAAPPDPSAALFPTDRVLEISITIAPADWEVLRHEPDQVGLPEDTCASQPGLEPYTYFPAAITIDGQITSNVAIRKKGNLGSLSTERPGLRVKANEYVDGQVIAGLRVLTLNNNNQDPSLISQCLGYPLFAQAGLPASRCAFAHVTVNGVDLGIYSHVETIRSEMLGRHFADTSGHLYESGGDFEPGGTGGFQPKVNSSMPDCSDLDAVVTALAAPPDQLVSQLGAVVNLDNFMRYWAMEVLLGHWDGYANNRNNFYFYHDPGSDQLHFMPWGIDALFTERPRTTRPESVYACGAMPWRLYDAAPTRALYLAELDAVLDEVWNEAAIQAEIDRLAALLAPFVAGDSEVAEAIASTRAFVAGRRATLTSELGGATPVWPYDQGADSCLINLGTVQVSFTTTWDTLEVFGQGSGQMSGNVSGTPLASDTVFASAGLDQEGRVVMQVFAELPDGRYAVVFALVPDPAQFVPGALTLDLISAYAVMLFYDPVTEEASGGGLLFGGLLNLSMTSLTPGGVVAGEISGTVYEL